VTSPINTAAASVVACPECDAIQTLRHPASSRGADCFRCGASLARGGGDRLNLALAFTLGALPLFVAANVFPLLNVRLPGQTVAATVLGSVGALREQQPLLAALVLFLAVLIPAIWLGGAAYLLLSLRRGPAPGAGAVFRLLETLGPWAQVEILLLGLVVVFAKLAAGLSLSPGPALPCLLAFLLLARLAGNALDARHYWRRFTGAPA
jgi:paraquat-inducible protein A